MPKQFLILILVFFSLSNCKEKNTLESTGNEKKNLYLQNSEPLVEKPYLILALGAIKPQGWLLGQLQKMRDGMTEILMFCILK